MAKEEMQLLRMLFYRRGGRYFEVIDNDGIRKPAITTCLIGGSLKDDKSYKEDWKVEIDWQLLDKWMDKNNGKQ